MTKIKALVITEFTGLEEFMQWEGESLLLRSSKR